MTETVQARQRSSRRQTGAGRSGIVMLLATLAATLTSLPSEAGIRIVYENGVVVRVGRSGNEVLDWQKLELPDAATGVHSVAVDYRRRKVYLVVEAPARHAAALVLDLASLRRVGRIPGVLRLHVPVSDEAPFLLVQRLDPGSGHGAEYGDPETIDSALYDTVLPSLTEWRPRSSPLRVTSVQEAGYVWNDRHLCYEPHLKLYFDTGLAFGFDAEFRIRSAGTEGSWLMPEWLKRASIAGCAPSGQMLLIVPRESANDGMMASSASPLVDIVRWSSRSGESARLRPESISRSTLVDPRSPELLLGRGGEYALINDRFYRFDPASNTPVLPELGGTMQRSDRLVVPDLEHSAYGTIVLGRSHDGSEVYLGRREYQYRSAVTPSRVLNPGAQRYLHSSVTRVDVADDSVTVTDLDLPAATTAYRFRQMLIRLIESDESLSEESRMEAMQGLETDPWQSPWIQLDELAIAIGDSGVIGVIVDNVEKE